MEEKNLKIEEKEEIVITFAGDSGDGMQLTGFLFSVVNAIWGNDVQTLPDYPAEIRAPAGTVHGVSGYQVRIAQTDISSPGIYYDILVALNAAALKKHLKMLKPNGLLIVNTGGFDRKNLEKAEYATNPLSDEDLKKKYNVIEIDISRFVKEILADTQLSTKDREKTKNMFVLGLCAWLFDRDIAIVEKEIKEKFSKKNEILEANLKVLRAGFNYGETTELLSTRFRVQKAKLEPGKYRFITGNEAIAIGIMLIHEKTGLKVLYASYPITPASDVLHFLAEHYNYEGVEIVQAEDEIAAACCAIGASYAGGLGITATSGPGFSLKSESIGLAVMLEIPLVVIDLQRAGPSTGMPTKTEQADLLQAMFGRHGEAPVVVMAASSPANAAYMTYYAAKIALEHMTPVILLSDAYLANAAEPIKISFFDNLPEINPPFFKPPTDGKGITYMPYKRNENYVREWVLPGTPELMHTIGGLEKEDITGRISYDPDNHQKMVYYRLKKIQSIANVIPPQVIEIGSPSDDILILSWGSTWGAAREAALKLRKLGFKVAFTNLNFINPLPRNLGELLSNFSKIFVPELNTGQLAFLLRAYFNLPIYSITKIKGVPFSADEIIEEVKLRIKDPNKISTN